MRNDELLQFAFPLAFAVCSFLLAIPCAAEPEALRAVALLDYVAHDYGGGRQNLAAWPALAREHDEQLAILTALEPALDPMKARVPNAPAELAELRREVRSYAPAELVAARASKLAEDIAGAHALDRLPRRAPDKARGMALYLEHCASCHGRFGSADTQRARSLVPRPAAFTSEADLSPQRAWQTAAFGVPGTAMVGFSFLDDDSRWDAAFFLLSLRHREPVATAAPRYPPAELATMSDAALADALFAAGAAERALPGMVAGLRLGAAFSDPCREPGAEPAIACARQELLRARQALGWQDRGLARTMCDRAHRLWWQGRPFVAAIGPALFDEIDERMMLLRSRLPAEAIANGARDVDTLLARIAVAQMTALGAGPPGFWRGASMGARAGLLLAALLVAASSFGGRKARRKVALGAIAGATIGAATRSAGPALWSQTEVAGAILALAAAWLLVHEACRGIEELAPRARRISGAWLATAPFAVLAGDAIWRLQIAGWLPIHARAFIGTPALGVHPSIEALAGQALLAAIWLALVAPAISPRASASA